MMPAVVCPPCKLGDVTSGGGEEAAMAQVNAVSSVLPGKAVRCDPWITAYHDECDMSG